MKAAICWIVLFALFLIPAFVKPSPTPDWPAWVVGARLAGNASLLYSFSESQKITRTFAEPQDGVWAFVRPPVYASLLQPLSWMTPPHAYVVWQLFNLACLAAALWLLWPARLSPVFALLFPPIITSFKQGQDMPVFLLAFAIALKMLARYPVVSGLVLSVLGIKFHLLLLLPCFFLTKSQWRMAAGFAAGGCLMVASCFLLYGRTWYAAYSACILENQKHLPAGGFGLTWVALVIVLAIGLSLALRHFEPAAALMLTMAVSLFAAPHLYFYDFCLAFPLLLVAVKFFSERTYERAYSSVRPSPVS